MIFNVFRYISPVWYFNLEPNNDWQYFPKIEQIRVAKLPLEIDGAYQSKEAQERDLAYRAFQIGYISRNPREPGLNIWEPVKIPIVDEYRFLRKNFHPIWVLYTLIIRLLSLCNPLREINAYWHSRNTQRENYINQAISYKGYNQFESKLLKEEPLVSIIIPTLNRYQYLKDVFSDLEKQTYPNFEVIVVDQTDPFDENVYKGWNFSLRFWYQEEKALWRARNEAIQVAKGAYVLLYDDDSRVDEDWIEQHIKTLDFFNADLSSGVSISTVGAKVPAHYSYFRWSDQLDTGNVLLKKQIFSEIGLFDRTFEKQRMGDGEFGLRAYLAGFKNISNPKAKRLHLKVGSGGLRQMGSWDAFRPKKFWGPRPIPSVLYLYRKYFGKKLAIWALMKNVPPSIVHYKFKKKKSFLILGSILSLVLMPIIFFQVISSWRISSKQLENSKVKC